MASFMAWRAASCVWERSLTQPPRKKRPRRVRKRGSEDFMEMAGGV